MTKQQQQQQRPTLRTPAKSLLEMLMLTSGLCSPSNSLFNTTFDKLVKFLSEILTNLGAGSVNLNKKTLTGIGQVDAVQP